jgi:hypothetical protein
MTKNVHFVVHDEIRASGVDCSIFWGQMAKVNLNMAYVTMQAVK